jgi:diaminopimelate epimerase
VAVAAVVAQVRRLDPPATVDVRVPGGDLVVRLRGDGGADLIGPAVLVAQGTWPLT